VADPEASPINNPVHVAFCVAIFVAATGLLWFGKLTSAEWVSAVTWTAGILVLGRSVGVVATGYTVVAQTKAAQTIQSMKASAA
jgi:hypothetical protein